MKSKSRNTFFSLVMALAFSISAFAASEEKLDHDNSILSIFVQPSISFISFEERKYFQEAIDTIYYEFRANAVNNAESLNVAKQDFQKVNFCFPVTAGLQYQFMEDHFISAGIGFIYDNESVVLTDRKGKTHSYEYTLQGVPLFLEYRFALPKNFITLSTGGLFSIAVRWYWALPGTEIYTTWGYLGAKTPLLGAGFGVSVGYLFASWKNFKLYGDIGFNSISVKSDKKFSDIVPNGPEETAKWNLGGIQLQIRGTFGFWNKPKINDDSDDDDDDDDDDDTPKSKKKSVRIVDSLKTKSNIVDSLKNVADSLKTNVADNAKADTNVADSLKNVADSLKTNVVDSTKADTNVADSLKNVADSLKTNVADSAKADTNVADSTNANVTDSAKVDSVSKAVADSANANVVAPQKNATAAPANTKSKGD